MQLADALRQGVVGGLAGSRRRAAVHPCTGGHLAVSRGTVVAAYDQLTAEGYLVAQEGRSTVINPRLAALHPVRPSVPARLPDAPVRPVARPATRTAVDRGRGNARLAGGLALLRQPTRSPAPAPPRGTRRLRTELADHLRRMRGVDTVAGPVGGDRGRT